LLVKTFNIKRNIPQKREQHFSEKNIFCETPVFPYIFYKQNKIVKQ